MPAIISTIGLLVPVTYSMEITRGIVLRGAGIATFWKAALALVGFSVGLGTVGALGLKKRWR
jgi:ABC-2 type transport system permease protein